MNNVVSLPVKSTEKAPEFITPSTLSTLSDAEIDALIEGIRVRRMDKHTLYKETRKLRDKASSTNMLKQFETKMGKLVKLIEATDKHLEKLDKAANEVRALRVMMGETSL